MFTYSGTAGPKIRGVIVAIAWGIATVVSMAVPGAIVGFACSYTGLVHGEAAAWFPLISAFYGFLAGLAIGPVFAWKRIARLLGVSRKATWTVAIGLLTVIPATEYAVLRSPRITGPSVSSSTVHIESISNDGQTVLLTVTRDDSSLIYRVDTQTGKTVRLTSIADFEEGPSLSPDNKQVAYVSSRHHNEPSEIVLCEIDGGNIRPLLPGQSDNDFAPIFSRTGRTTYFARYTSTERYARGFEIYSVKTDGTELRQLTHAAFGSGDVYSIYPESISSDETQVLMNASSNAGDRILLYSLIDQTRAPVVVVPRIPNAPADAQIVSAYFTADDKGIIFMAASQGAKSYDYDVYKLDLSSRNVQKLTSTNGYASDFRVSPDRERAAFFTWSSSRLNSVPIDPRLQILNIRTGRVSAVTLAGLP